MSIPTDEEIKRWRDRWAKVPGLARQIVDLITPNLDEPDAEDGKARLVEVHNLFKVLGNGDFEYFGFCENDWPVLDLRGISLENKNMNCVTLMSAHLEGTFLRNVNFTKSWLAEIHLERAHGIRVKFDHCELFKAHLERSKWESNSSFLKANLFASSLDNSINIGANFECANLSDANPTEANLLASSFYGSQMSGCKLIGAKFRNAKFGLSKINGLRTIFINNSYVPSYSELIMDSISIRKKLLGLWKRFWNYWFYTDFSGICAIEEANTILATDLYRYAMDQRIVQRTKDKSKCLYWFWNLTTACGWSTVRLMFWAILVIIGFACLYANFGLVTPPDLVTHTIAEHVIPSIGPALDPLGHVAPKETTINVSPAFQWFYVSFDIFTNLGIRVTTKPAPNWGVVVMFIETVMGWMTLGLALTVFANKYARRS